MHEPYTAYAAIYDQIGQGRFGEELAARTLSWAEAGSHKPLRVLDLACGTGAAALVFAAAGHQVTGVDCSPAMLDLARGKAQRMGLDIEWVQCDLRNLASVELSPSFDLAICFFDSLNYLTGNDDLLNVYRAVSALLRSGGTFVFDLHTEAEFATWNERDEVIHDDAGLLVYNRLRYDEAHRRGTGRVVWFTREIDRWWRDEELHTERPWSEQEVRPALEAAGLRFLTKLTPEGKPPTDDATRVVYYAER